MADELVQLTDGTNTVNFLSKESATTGYLKRNVEGLDPPPCEIRYAGGRPVSREWQNREMTITFGIVASDASDLTTKKTTIITILENTYLYWVSNGKRGAKAQFQYRRPDGTNISYADVYSGECDWGTVEHQRGAAYAYVLEGAQLHLTCETGLHPSTVVSLGPSELGTPDFEEDGDANGLADQWNEVGSPATTIDTTIYLVGSQSQKLVLPAGGDPGGVDGIQSDTFIIDSTTAVIYAYVYRASGDEIKVKLYDVTAGQYRGTTAAYSMAGWATKTGANSNTWKRLAITDGTIVSGNTHRLDVVRETGDASAETTYYVDQCFVLGGTTTIPTEWIGCELISNSFSAATEGRINHVNATDLEGDLDAPCNIKLEPVSEFTGVDIDKFWVAMVGPMADIKHWGEIDMSYDANRSNESRYMNTVAASYSDWAPCPPTPFSISFDADEWEAMAGRTWRVLGGMYANATTVKWRLRASLRSTTVADAVVLHTGDAINHPEASQWCIVDLGPLYLSHSMAGDYSGDKVFVGYQWSNPEGATATLEVDFLCFIPEHDYSLLVDKSASGLFRYIYRATTDKLYIKEAVDFPHHVFTESYTGPENIGCLGSSEQGVYPRLKPGVDNRIIFLFAEDGDRHNVTRQFKVSIDYLPQYLVPLE